MIAGHNDRVIHEQNQLATQRRKDIRGAVFDVAQNLARGRNRPRVRGLDTEQRTQIRDPVTALHR
ncbi:hypothetical protein [Rhodococcus jostii]|uniref:hypothetical protein n=1 Tax=Rhodococcus jostii TaxID=132919 RepID=UPI00115FD723|nr:hypothetical protein [Rhodococcus jostii]